MEKVRMGLIGCGTVAGYGHLPALTSIPETELVAISDLNEQRLAEFQEKYGIEAVYTDYRELLARDDIEAVGVATPLDKHHCVVMDAAAAGKHVFCEKPIGETPEQGAEMIEAMARAGKLFAINFEMRHTEPHPKMKSLLDKGSIGDLKVIRCTMNWQGGRWAGAERYRMLITEGLGPIVDCGIHYFDLCRWYSGSNFSEISAQGTYIEAWPNPDHVIATCRMDDGTLVLIETGWAYTHTCPQHSSCIQIELLGTEGVLGYTHWQTSVDGDESRRELNVFSNDGCYREPITTATKAFGTMYSLFAQSVRKGELIDLPSGRDGLSALEASLKALRLAK